MTTLADADVHPLYAHRRADAVVLNTTLDAEAVAVLRQYCPAGRRSTGKFLARLIFEHDARVRERQQLRGYPEQECVSGEEGQPA